MTKESKFIGFKKKYIQEMARSVSGKKILDVGCGLGEYTSLFSSDNEVVGLDIVDRRKVYDFEFVKYDGSKFPFSRNSFDVVVSWDVIEHIEKDADFVREVKRVLRPRGIFVCGTPNRSRLANVLRRIFFRPVKYPLVIQKNSLLGDVIHVREYTSTDLMRLVNSVGLKHKLTDRIGFGIRGKIDLCIATPIVAGLENYLVCIAEK